MDKLTTSSVIANCLSTPLGGAAFNTGGSEEHFAALLERGGQGEGERHPDGRSVATGRERQASSGEGEASNESATVGELMAQRRPPMGEPAVAPISEARGGGAVVPDLGALDQLLRSVAVQTLGERSSVQLEVGAAKLDSLKISLRWDGQRLHANFDLGDVEQYRLVRSAVGELEEALRHRGVASEKIEVGLSSSAEGGAKERGRGGERSQHESWAGRGSKARSVRSSPALLLRRGPRADLA